MIAERTINSITWIAESPSVYVLKGYPWIIARYNGQCWKVDQIHYPFEDMAEISDLVTDTQVYLAHTKSPDIA